MFVAHNVRFDYGFIRREFAPWALPGAVPTCARCGCRARCIRRCRVTISTPSWNVTESRSRTAIAPCPMRRRCWRSGASCARRGRVTSCRAPGSGQPSRHVAGRVAPGSARRPCRRGRVFTGSSVSGRRRGDTLLYVGKANILRERVLDHFRGGAGDAKVGEALPRRCGAWSGPRLRASSVRSCSRRAKCARRSRYTTARLRGGGERLTWLFDDGAAAPQLVTLNAQVAALGQCLRHLSHGPRCTARARGSGARASVVLQVVRPGERAGFVFRPAGGPVQGRLRRQGTGAAAHGARQDRTHAAEAQALAARRPDVCCARARASAAMARHRCVAASGDDRCQRRRRHRGVLRQEATCQ